MLLVLGQEGTCKFHHHHHHHHHHQFFTMLKQSYDIIFLIAYNNILHTHRIDIWIYEHFILTFFNGYVSKSRIFLFLTRILFFSWQGEGSWGSSQKSLSNRRDVTSLSPNTDWNKPINSGLCLSVSLSHYYSKSVWSLKICFKNTMSLTMTKYHGNKFDIRYRVLQKVFVKIASQSDERNVTFSRKLSTSACHDKLN